MVGPSKRHYGQSMSIAFGVGYCLVTAYAYGFPHWKDLTVACALTSVPVILIMALLPKSARFLYLTGKPDEGWTILKNFAKRTNSKIPEDFNKNLNDHSLTKDSLMSKKCLFKRTPKSEHRLYALKVKHTVTYIEKCIFRTWLYIKQASKRIHECIVLPFHPMAVLMELLPIAYLILVFFEHAYGSSMTQSFIGGWLKIAWN